MYNKGIIMYLGGIVRMICFKCIGGIGNQMFVYAAARAFQLKQKEKVILVYEQHKKNSDSYPYDLTALNINRDLLNTDITFENVIKKWKVEKIFALMSRKVVPRIKRLGIKAEKVIMKIMQPLWNIGGCYHVGYMVQWPMKIRLTKNMICEGYFQSSIYFSDYKKIIQQELRVKEGVFDVNKELIELVRGCESICVHVRRGDYTIYKEHLVCTVNYYQKALEFMQSLHLNATYFVFSDDIEWTKQNISWPENTIFAEELRNVVQKDVDYKNPFIDLQVMYECKHFIISNSSFSWWAQFLAQNSEKIVVAPDRWLKNHVIEDIYEDFWKLIEVE